MRFQINDIEVVFPTSLAEITLGQKIDYFNQYGKDLNDMLASILLIEDEFEREMELIQYQVELMYANVAFFAGCTPDALKESDFMDTVANIYHSCTKTLLEDEATMDVQTEFIWNDEQWEIHPPELKHGSPMKFGEFIDSKQIIKNMIDLGKGRWETLVPLCAIYFRKKGEPYQESFIYEGSDRQKLMLDLPLNMAMQVGFFLISSMSSLMDIFHYSGSHQQNPESTPASTLSAGGGSTS